MRISSQERLVVVKTLIIFISYGRLVCVCIIFMMGMMVVFIFKGHEYLQNVIFSIMQSLTLT